MNFTIQSINIGPIFSRLGASANNNNNNNPSTANNNTEQAQQNASNAANGGFKKTNNFENFFNFLFSTAENFTSSLLSAFGIATQAPPVTNNQSRNNTNTTTTNTTASAGSQSTNQEGQLPRSRISQLFVPISMNRSRRVIFRRSSGRCSDRQKQNFSQIKKNC